MPRPARTPVGLELARAAKVVSRSFENVLAAAGGSQARWLILMSLKAGHVASQRELARAIGIRGATLTAHLDGMEADGLLTRRRDPANRRVHLVELTERGEQSFHQLRQVAMQFDRRLRHDLSEEDLAGLYQLLGKLQRNAVAVESPS